MKAQLGRLLKRLGEFLEPSSADQETSDHRLQADSAATGTTDAILESKRKGHQSFAIARGPQDLRAANRDRRRRPDQPPNSRASSGRVDAHQTSERRHAQRRSHQRHPSPMGLDSLQGELNSADGRQWFITVWDLSKGGACVFTKTLESIPLLGEKMVLSVFDTTRDITYSIDVAVTWSSKDEQARFIGLRFLGLKTDHPFYKLYLADD